MGAFIGKDKYDTVTSERRVVESRQGGQAVSATYSSCSRLVAARSPFPCHLFSLPGFAIAPNFVSSRAGSLSFHTFRSRGGGGVVVALLSALLWPEVAWVSSC